MIYTKKCFYIYIYSVIFISCFLSSTFSAIHGRYTENIEDYELSIPHRVTQLGEFISFEIPQYFTYNINKRYKREAPATEKIHYNIIFGGEDHHLEVWPNHGFISPTLVSENYDHKIPVQKRNLRKVETDKLCHFIGKVKGDELSSVAVSVCDGLAGYFLTNDGHYFIEPIAEHEPNEYGQHVHVVFKRQLQDDFVYKIYPPGRCGMRNNWEDAWLERLREPRTIMDGTHTIRHYIELLIVADKKFIDHHKHNDLEQYILTIINMVYSYFNDASIGSEIDIQVVRIIYLDKVDEHLDLSIDQNAEETLSSFCKWTTNINPKDFKNPQRHDIAILLTRFDLCSDNKTDCSVMGLAYVAGTCQNDRSCSINEDNGLALGITITHEMGHLLGCGHDGSDSPCDVQSSSGDYFIMSPYIHMSTIKWSSCSKKFINEFFESGLGECLEDVPEVSLFDEVNEMLPGAVYDADYQCENEFPGMHHCILEQSKICEMLYCKAQDGVQCVSKGEPPADGTKCGDKMWCYRNQCVRMGTQAGAIDGGWGDWGEWSKCSRTCGGGITISERHCDNPHPQNHGEFCMGEKRRIKMCNIEDCLLGPSFREIQCMGFNDVPFKNKLHAWKPYHVKGHECDLTCINEDSVYVKLAKAKDGTPCKRGLKDRCIFGKCRKVGCDWVIGSSAIEDICGMCNGDGTHCKLIEKEFNQKILTSGYYKIDKIPAGVRNINVYEKQASQNTIAISSEDGKTFYLNGDFTEEVNGDKYFGDVLGLYEHPTTDKETLNIPGPTKEPLLLYEVFYTPENPGIKYTYVIPSTKQTSASYFWKFTEFGPCSTVCDWGYRISEPICTEKTRGEVATQFCDIKTKPENKVMECFMRECKIKWHPHTWGKCSGCKNQPGTRNRTVECVREAQNTELDPVIVDDSLCTGVKPKAQQMCCSEKPCNPNSNEHKDEVQKKIAGLGTQLQRIRPTYYKKNKETSAHVKFEIFKPERLEIKSNLRDAKDVKRNSDKYTLLSHDFPSKLKRSEDTKYPGVEELECASPTSEKNQILEDHVPPEGLQLVEVPIIQDNEDIKLSDVGMQRSGDKVADTLNFCKAKVFKGKDADEEIKQLKPCEST